MRAHSLSASRPAFVAASVLLLVGAASAQTSIRVRAWIDGRSQLILDDHSATWQHFDFAAPGRLDCDKGTQTQPTYLDDVPWWPLWPDQPTCENRDCGGCLSDTYDDLASTLPNAPFQASLTVHQARGIVGIAAFPSASNGYRVVVEFNDNAPAGADWYDVELAVSACGDVVSYCSSTPNSSGAMARLELLGSLSISGKDTQLRALDCPAHSCGVFVYGRRASQLPFGNGVLCISPLYPGLLRVPALAVTGADGSVQAALDFDALPAAGKITPDTTWFFQFWFRDPLAGAAGTNLSDALAATFCP